MSFSTARQSRVTREDYLVHVRSRNNLNSERWLEHLKTKHAAMTERSTKTDTASDLPHFALPNGAQLSQ